MYYKGVDALRGMAALSVLFAHITQELGKFGLNPYYIGHYPDGNPKSTLLAGYGVSIFFTISGYLICLSLLQASKTDFLIKFYLKRILRIWPIYFLYILLVSLTYVSENWQINKISFLFYILLSGNIPFTFWEGLPLLGHFWSLGVEEQFYFFFPLLFFVKKRFIKSVLIICILLISAKITCRLYEIINPYSILSIYYKFFSINRFQCIFIGVIGAYFTFHRNIKFLRLINSKPFEVISWVFITLALLNINLIPSVISNEVFSVFGLTIIANQVNNKKTSFKLTWKPLVFCGSLSYGIYVYHPLIIFWISKIPFKKYNISLDILGVYIICFVASVLISYLSFIFVEKPFLEIKKKCFLI